MATRRTGTKKQPKGDTKTRTVGSRPQRRSTDLPEQRTWQHRFHIYARENWYRDVWMVILTLIVIATVASSQSTSNQAKQAAVEAKSDTRKIQAERAFYIENACRNQNARHDATINELLALYKHPSRPLRLNNVNPEIVAAFNLLTTAQRNAGRTGTILLINALVPHQNCAQAVKAGTTN